MLEAMQDRLAVAVIGGTRARVTAFIYLWLPPVMEPIRVLELKVRSTTIRGRRHCIGLGLTLASVRRCLTWMLTMRDRNNIGGREVSCRWRFFLVRISNKTRFLSTLCNEANHSRVSIARPRIEREIWPLRIRGGARSRELTRATVGRPSKTSTPSSIISILVASWACKVRRMRWIRGRCSTM